MFWIISAKVTRIDNYATDNTGKPKSKDAPVKTWCASSPALPSVHPLTAICVFVFDKNRRGGLQEIFFRREEIIIGDQYCAADFFGCEIDEFSEIHLTFRIEDEDRTACFGLRHV